MADEIQHFGPIPGGFLIFGGKEAANTLVKVLEGHIHQDQGDQKAGGCQANKTNKGGKIVAQ